MFHSLVRMSDEQFVQAVTTSNNDEDKKRKSTKYKDIYAEIDDLNCIEVIPMDLFNGNTKDKRLFSIKVIKHTEGNYVSKLIVMLKEIFPILYKESRKIGKKIVSNNELNELMKFFLKFYHIHSNMYINLTNNDNIHQIGELIINHLEPNKVLSTYISYIEKFTIFLDLCYRIRNSNDFYEKNLILSSFESILMIPIQRFPQLECAIGDLYKNTSESHNDKLNLYKALSLIKSFSMRLDYSRKFYESSNCKDTFSILKKRKINVISTKIHSQHTVYLINYGNDYSISQILCNLLLCDKEVIIYPLTLHNSSLIFTLNISNIDFQFKNISYMNKKKDLTSLNDFYKIKQLFYIIKDGSNYFKLMDNTFDMLKDYYLLIDVMEKIRKLNFNYSGVDVLEVSKSVLNLEIQLKEKERDINQLLTSFLTLKNNNNDDKIMLNFNSIKESNNWKINFCRTKLLLDMNVISDWWYYPSNKKITEINSEELPLLLNQEYIISKNGIINLSYDVVIIKVISIIVGTKIFRCLWLLMKNGQIVILHFDYKTWRILESIDSNIIGQSIYACTVSIYNYETTSILHDIEIWIGLNDEIYIYSLLENRTIIKTKLTTPSKISGLCYCNNQMLVLLDNLNLMIYKPTKLSKWICNYIVKLRSDNKLIKNIIDIQQIDQQYIYIIYQNQIYLIEYVKETFMYTKTLQLTNSITAHCCINDGLWLCFDNDKKLIFYDKQLKNVLHNIELPNSLIGVVKLNNVSSMMVSDKYIWLGMDNGLIICITMMDSLYSINHDVPLYFSTSAFNGPVRYIIQFQNIHGISVKKKNNNHTFDSEENSSIVFRRSQSTQVQIDWSSPYAPGLHLRNSSTLPISVPPQSGLGPPSPAIDNSDNESSCSSLHLENLQNVTPKIVICLGTGLGRISEIETCPTSPPPSASFLKKKNISMEMKEETKFTDFSYSYQDENVLLTFLE